VCMCNSCSSVLLVGVIGVTIAHWRHHTVSRDGENRIIVHDTSIAPMQRTILLLLWRKFFFFFFVSFLSLLKKILFFGHKCDPRDITKGSHEKPSSSSVQRLSDASSIFVRYILYYIVIIN